MSTELSRLEGEQPQPKKPDDLRGVMALSVEDANTQLAEYQSRRQNFRDWLQSQLIEGTHYGFPPYCKPQEKVDETGLRWFKNGKEWLSEKQWTPKPSLYQSGADFVCDLMGVQPQFEPDVEAWKMLGEPKGVFVFRCRLVSKLSGAVVGEGYGSRRNGAKGQDENASIKMAMKSAKVSAVINAYSLTDLFTQDLETQSQTNAPEQRRDAPQAETRDRRPAPVTREQLRAVVDDWKTYTGPDGRYKEDVMFAGWACDVLGEKNIDNVRNLSWWTQDRLAACKRRISAERGDPGPQGELFSGE